MFFRWFGSTIFVIHLDLLCAQERRGFADKTRFGRWNEAKKIDPLLSSHDIQELEEWFGSICPDIGVALPDFLTLTHKLDKPAPRSEFFKEVKGAGRSLLNVEPVAQTECCLN